MVYWLIVDVSYELRGYSVNKWIQITLIDMKF